jgi:hypothetical protein
MNERSDDKKDGCLHIFLYGIFFFLVFIISGALILFILGVISSHW